VVAATATAAAAVATLISLLYLHFQLILNGFFGFQAFRATKCILTRIVGEEWLKKLFAEEEETGRRQRRSAQPKRNRRRAIMTEDVFEMSLLGVVMRPEPAVAEEPAAAAEPQLRQTRSRPRRRKRLPELLYSISSHQPNRPIHNLVQASCMILGNSR